MDLMFAFIDLIVLKPGKTHPSVRPAIIKLINLHPWWISSIFLKVCYGLQTLFIHQGQGKVLLMTVVYTSEWGHTSMTSSPRGKKRESRFDGAMGGCCNCTWNKKAVRLGFYTTLDLTSVRNLHQWWIPILLLLLGFWRWILYITNFCM